MDGGASGVLLLPLCCCTRSPVAQGGDGAGAKSERVYAINVFEEESVPVAVGGADAADEDGGQSELEERPAVDLGDGATYKGQWKGKLKHGLGTFTGPDGTRYDGSFLQDHPHGWGRIEAGDGATYEGYWDQGWRHGYGRHTQADGIVYEGSWKDDDRSGWGVESHPDGACYRGLYVDGCRQGHGRYEAKTGAAYEGEFRDDMMHGQGTCSFTDGRRYVGQWQCGRMSGNGRTDWPDGTRHEGKYLQDSKHGQGTFTWPDGWSYIGNWRKGEVESDQGMIVTSTGEQFSLAAYKKLAPIVDGTHSICGDAPSAEKPPSSSWMDDAMQQIRGTQRSDDAGVFERASPGKRILCTAVIFTPTRKFSGQPRMKHTHPL